jgi:hypothetical protein
VELSISRLCLYGIMASSRHRSRIRQPLRFCPTRDGRRRDARLIDILIAIEPHKLDVSTMPLDHFNHVFDEGVIFGSGVHECEDERWHALSRGGLERRQANGFKEAPERTRRELGIPGARNIPVGAKFDGLRPTDDFNTRVVVFGRDGNQARSVAEAISASARHNVSYFGGTFETLKTAIT